MNHVSELIQNSDPAEWINAISDFQKRSIENLLDQGMSLEEIAEAWLAASVAETAPFSSGTPPQHDPSFLNRLKEEVAAYVCGAKKYDGEREKAASETKGLHALTVSTMAVAIAPYLGAAAPVISPVIALILATIGKLTLNAWCKTRGFDSDQA